MKRLTIVFVICFCIAQTYCQKLSLSDLTSLCSKSNWDGVNTVLINKGWEFYDSKKGDSEHYDVITWSYNKNYYDDKASGWMKLYTTEGTPDKIQYEVFNDNSYKIINSSIKSSGFKYIKSVVNDNIITTSYEGTSYYLDVYNEKRNDDDWSNNSTTGYYFIVTRKGGVYDIDNGVKYEYYWGDVVKTKYTLKNGKFNGEYKTYYSNGKLEVSLNFINDKKEGEAKAYYEDGSLKKHSYYSNDLENGKVVNYDLKGQISSEYYMKEGELSGLAKNYIDGKLDNETEYLMGKANGIHKEYIYDGSKITFMSTSHYLNGEKNGLEVIFINTDKGMDTLSFINYSNGLKHGTFREVSIDTIVSGTYYYGKLSGKYARKVNFEYIIDNEEVNAWFPESEGFYSDGKKAGTWKYFLRGIPFSEGQYQNDKKSGVWIQTVPIGFHAGELWSRTTFLNGLLNGKDETYFIYDSDIGAFTKCSIIANYRNGKLNGEYIGADSLGFVYDKGSYIDDQKVGNWLEIQNIDIGTDVIKFAQEGTYVNDKREGIWTNKVNNELRSKINYSKGKFHGQALYYDSDKVWKEANYNAGQFTNLIYYNSYPNDTIEKYIVGWSSASSFDLSKYVYHGDSTVLQTFRVNAKIDTINVHNLANVLEQGTSYSFLHGQYQTINSNKQIIRKGVYYQGLLNGDNYYYDYDQQVYRKQTYRYNALESEYYYDLENKPYSGVFKVADNKGNVTAKIKISKSLRNGPTLYLDSKGKVVRKEKYKNGKLEIK